MRKLKMWWEIVTHPKSAIERAVCSRVNRFLDDCSHGLN